MWKISVALSPEKTKFGPLLFTGDLEHGIDVAAELGFDAVELSIRDPSVLDIDHIAKMLEGRGLSVSTIATGQSYYTDGLSPANLDDEVRARWVSRFKDIIALAARFETQVIIGGVRGKFSEDEKTMQREKAAAAAAIWECAEYAQERGVRLLLEPINRYETNFVNTLEEGVEFIDLLGSANVGLLPDTFHMNIEEFSLPEAILQVKEFIGCVHFADSNRLAPGCGHIDFRSILDALSTIGYSGYICAEILPKPDDLTAAKTAAETFQKLFAR